MLVHMGGLIYFHGCDIEAKRALLPNGTKPEGHVPVHNASLWIEPAQLESADWWEGGMFDRLVEVVDDKGIRQNVHVLELRILEPAEIIFPETSEKTSFVNLDVALPKLAAVDPSFELDLENADTIAQLSIRGGRLEAFEFTGVPIVQWTIANDSALLTITARAARKSRTVTLKHVTEAFGNEVVFTNTPDLLPSAHQHEGGMAGGEHEKSHDHFSLYRKLNKTRSAAGLEAPKPVENLNPLPFSHSYLRALSSGPELGEPGCTPTCC